MATLVFLAAQLLVADAPPIASENLGQWNQLRVESLRDFDDLHVAIDGERHNAFLIGLRPLRDIGISKCRQKRLREIALDYFRKSDLSCRIIERRGDRVGIMVDAFSHMEHPFTEKWDPAQYPWCRTGWGAYNFNLYFLHLKLTQFEENFDVKKNPTTKTLFGALSTKTKANE